MNFWLGCNYWASNAGTDMWIKFDEKAIRDDLDILTANGVEYMRVFPNWRDFQPVKVLRNWANTFEEYGEMFFYPVPDRVIYGYSTPQELLWGKALNGGVEVLPRLTLNYYLLIAAALTGLSGLLWMIFCQKRYSGVMRQLFLAPCTYLLAHLLLKGTETLTFFLVADFCCILLVAAALYALLSLGWQVWKQQQKEKQN